MRKLLCDGCGRDVDEVKERWYRITVAESVYHYGDRRAYPNTRFEKEFCSLTCSTKWLASMAATEHIADGPSHEELSPEARAEAILDQWGPPREQA